VPWPDRQTVGVQVSETITEADAVRAVDGRLLHAEDAVDYAPPRPPVYGLVDRWPVLEGRLPPRLPRTRVLELPGARVVSRIGWVVVDDRAVTSLSWWESMDREAPLGRIRSSRERRLEGTLLNLATMSGYWNYGHFLMDGLGRVAVAELAGVRLDDVDWVLVPGFTTPATRRMLAAAGIPPRKRIVPRRGLAVVPDVVLAPSMPGTTKVYRPSLPRYLRSLVPPGEVTVPRLYVTRPPDSRRPLLNRAAVDRLLAQHGFTAVDATEVDLAALMTRAQVVVGEHGAALADLAFCRPGTAVIELIPSDHMQPYYFSLARAAGLDYSAVVCRSSAHRPIDEPGASPHSVEVPLDALAEALAALPR
jgi:Glycosyltransferase 61